MPSKLVVTQGIRKNNLYHFQRSTIIGLATTTTIDDKQMLQIKYFINTCLTTIRRPRRKICTHVWFVEMMTYVLSQVRIMYLLLSNGRGWYTFLISRLGQYLMKLNTFGYWHLKMHFEKMMVNHLSMNILNSGSI